MDPEQQTIARDLIAKGLECLTPREADIFVARCVYNVPLRPIADAHKFSVERVRQIHLIALGKVRSHLFFHYRVRIAAVIDELEWHRKHERARREEEAERLRIRRLEDQQTPPPPNPLPLRTWQSTPSPPPPEPPTPPVDIWGMHERIREYRRQRVNDDLNWSMSWAWE
jgi:hypothetical protein